jgi:hypothetical protein
MMETDMSQEGKKKQRKMVQENYGGAKSGKCKRVKDPSKVGKEGSGKRSEGVVR